MSLYTLPLHHDVSAEVYLYIPHHLPVNLPKMLHYIHLWLYVALQEAPACCQNSFRAFLYLTPFTKNMPAHPEQSIEEININTGICNPCDLITKRRNDLIVYRWEEWFKVLLHETIHLLGLDDSIDTAWDRRLGKTLTSLSGITQANHAEMGVYEAYTEMWAEFLHLVFHVYEKKGNRDTALQRMLRHEQRHSVQQSEFLEDAIQTGRKYNSKIKIHSYYSFKTHLLVHIEDFLQHCLKSNGRQTPLCKNKTQTGKDAYEQWWRNTFQRKPHKRRFKTAKKNKSLRMTYPLNDIVFTQSRN